MRTGHYITIIVALGLIAALYWGVNTTPPKKADEQPPMAGAQMPAQSIVTLSIDSLLLASQKALPEHAQEDLSTLTQKSAVATSDVDKSTIYKEMGDLMLEHKQFAAAAHYYTESAKLDNSEKSLNFAGRFNLDLLHSAHEASVQAWAADNAITSFERSLEINPDNDTVKMALASAYVDGTGQPMQGIQLLLGITKEDPDNVQANLMLGQLSIRSGQNDKAISRFETVLKKDPENTEALYFLAEAYKNNGNKEKAIELLEKCKEIIDNPQFSSDIDEYINSFK